MSTIYCAEGVLGFWFDEIDSKSWWVKDPQFDVMLQERFSPLYHQAKQGELAHWRENEFGRLAEIIVLDQFTRNMFRDTPAAFATDPLALVLVQEAIALNLDDRLPQTQRNFLYMPFMHSESKVIHAGALSLFEEKTSKETLQFELHHKAIIDQFGRYPHRNEILGRVSSDEEVAFLQNPGSSF